MNTIEIAVGALTVWACVLSYITMKQGHSLDIVGDALIALFEAIDAAKEKKDARG